MNILKKIKQFAFGFIYPTPEELLNDEEIKLIKSSGLIHFCEAQNTDSIIKDGVRGGYKKPLRKKETGLTWFYINDKRNFSKHLDIIHKKGHRKNYDSYVVIKDLEDRQIEELHIRRKVDCAVSYPSDLFTKNMKSYLIDQRLFFKPRKKKCWFSKKSTNAKLFIYQQIEKEILLYLEPFKDDYNEQCFEYEMTDAWINDNMFQICVKGSYKNKNDPEKQTSFILLGCYINYYYKQIQITKISLPDFMRYKGIGKKLIYKLFLLSEKEQYGLIICNMVKSFYQRMIKRGALPYKGCSVQIVSETELF